MDCKKETNTQETGFMPLSSLIEMLPKRGANSLLYVKVEQGEIMLGGSELNNGLFSVL